MALPLRHFDRPREKGDYISTRIRQRGKARKVYREVLKLYRFKCAICEWSIPFHTPCGQDQPQGGCDIHHIIAFSEGGEDTKDNLILLCPNHHKQADTGVITPDEVRAYLINESETAQEWMNRLSKEYKMAQLCKNMN